MVDLNAVTLIGRVVKTVGEDEYSYGVTSNRTAFAKIPLAVNRRAKSGDEWKDEPSFFTIELYGKQAEALKPYLVKGKMIGVQGELIQHRWEKDGRINSRVAILAKNIQLLGGKPEASGNKWSGKQQSGQAQTKQAQNEPYPADLPPDDGGVPSTDDNEIPF